MSDVAATILESAAAAGGVAGATVAWLSFGGDRGHLREGRRKEQVAAMIREAQDPIDRKLDRLQDSVDRLAGEVAGNSQQIGLSRDRLSVLETKIEVFWKNVALDAARVLHSPRPERKRLDTLLERFSSGTMTPGEASELRAVLETIRDFEPGAPNPLRVQPGEQVAAAILLRTMEFA